MVFFTVKRDKDGKFVKCKARWALKRLQDKQKLDQQTDSPTSTRPEFRMTCQVAANKGQDLFHIDLKTAFLQGESYDVSRDVICQLPPEAGYPAHIGARLKRPAYGLNDAPRRWWNRLDTSLRSYGMTPTRVDRCCYVFYSKDQLKVENRLPHKCSLTFLSKYKKAIESLTDPITGSPSHGKLVSGIICFHVDDLFFLCW